MCKCPHCGKRINVGKLLRSGKPTAAQREAARLNGAKGGRPKKPSARHLTVKSTNAAGIMTMSSNSGHARIDKARAWTINIVWPSSSETHTAEKSSIDAALRLVKRGLKNGAFRATITSNRVALP